MAGPGEYDRPNVLNQNICSKVEGGIGQNPPRSPGPGMPRAGGRGVAADLRGPLDCWADRVQLVGKLDRRYHGREALSLLSSRWR